MKRVTTNLQIKRQILKYRDRNSHYCPTRVLPYRNFVFATDLAILSNNPPSSTTPTKELPSDITDYVAKIAAAYLSNNKVELSEVPGIISIIANSLNNLSNNNGLPRPLEPAVPIRESITHNHLVCLEDGKQLKLLKRHLRSSFGLTPEEYRRRWGLPNDYPMVAPAYSVRRIEIAKQPRLPREYREASRKQRAVKE